MESIEIVTLFKVPVRVLCYGDVTPSQIVKNPDKKPKKLILVIPGNPGAIEFYSEFGARLHAKSNLPVWIVAHGGLENLPGPRLSTHPDLYNLQGQVQQKRELIDSYLSGVTLRCIGHSIGAKMLLDILKSDEKYAKQMENVELLFPTFERMAETPAGKISVFCIKYLYWPSITLATLFHQFPNVLKVFLLKIFVFLFGFPDTCIALLTGLIEPRLLRKARNLLDDEMKTVVKRDDETIRKNLKRLHFYYGASDSWTPLTYYEDLKHSHPGINAEVDKNGIPHLFCLKFSVPVADLLVNWWENEN